MVVQTVCIIQTEESERKVVAKELVISSMMCHSDETIAGARHDATGHSKFSMNGF